MKPLLTIVLLTLSAVTMVGGVATSGGAAFGGTRVLSSVAAQGLSNRLSTPFTAMAFPTTRNGWVATKGRLLATSNGGSSWSVQHAGNGYVTAFDFVNPGHGWALTSPSLGPTPSPEPSHDLYRTTDSGRTWGIASTVQLLGVDFLNAQRGWGVQYVRTPHVDHNAQPPVGQVVETNDGGATWTRSSSAIAAQSVCFTSSTEGWAAEHNIVWRTTDSGGSWKQALRAKLNGPVGWFATVGCRATGVWVLFAATDTGASDQEPYVLYRKSSPDWLTEFDEGYFPSYRPRTKTPGPGNVVGPFSVRSSQTAFFAGDDLGAGHVPGQPTYGVEVIGTRTGGSHWVRHVIGKLDPTRPVALSFASATRGWIAGTELWNHISVILFTRDGGKTWARQYPR